MFRMIHIIIISLYRIGTKCLYISNAHVYGHLHAVKWHLHRCFPELIATYKERTLHYIYIRDINKFQASKYKS
jgi:hypothetical protein